MNISLLCKWWWRLEKGEGLWQEIVKKKYMKQHCISMLKKKPSNSPVWNDLLKVKDVYRQGRKMIVGNGVKTDFWHDTWCTDAPFSIKFAELFNICNEQNWSVAQIAQRGWRLTFRRWLGETLQNQMRELRDMLTSYALNEENDSPKWCWEKPGVFTVKTMYEQLCYNETGAPYMMIWRAKIPLKIKIWMWLVEQKAILTKDNLTKNGRHSVCLL